MKVSQLHAAAALPRGKEPPVLIGYDAGVGVGARAGLDAMVKKKSLQCTCRELNTGRAAPTLVTELPRLRC